MSNPIDVIFRTADLCSTEGENSPLYFIYFLEKLYEGVNNKADHFFEIAQVLYQNKPEYISLAIATWERALSYYNDDNNVIGKATCYVALAHAHYDLGIVDPNQYLQAIAKQELALEIYKTFGFEQEQALSYRNLGDAHVGLKNFSQAIDLFDKAAEILKRYDQDAEAYCYSQIAKAYAKLHELNDAFEYQEKAADLYRINGEQEEEAEMQSAFGVILHEQGVFPSALKYQQRARDLYREIGDEQQELNCYKYIAGLYGEMGDYIKVINCCKHVLEIVEKKGGKPEKGSLTNHLIAASYSMLGSAYQYLGDFGLALSYNEEALKLCEANDFSDGIARCYAGLASAYIGLGDQEDLKRAIHFLNKSLLLSQQNNDERLEAACYTNKGVAYFKLCDYRKAIDYQEKALAIKSRNNDNHGVASCYSSIGNVQFFLKELDKAIFNHDLALKVFSKINDKNGQALCFSNIGLCYNAIGKPKKAKESFEKALEIQSQTGDIDSERLTLHTMGAAFYDKNPKAAFEYLAKSIELAELVSEKLVAEAHKISFYSHSSDEYQLIVPLCLKLNNESGAFEYAERGRSKAFLELLASTELEPVVKSNDKLELLLREENNYLNRIRAIRQKYAENKYVKPREIQEIRKELDEVYIEIEKIDPEYVFNRKGHPLSLEKMQLLIASYKKATILLEYFVTADTTYIFIISSRGSKIQSKSVPLTKKMIEKFLKEYRKEIVDYPKREKDKRDIGSSWLAISKYLIEPVSEYITQGDLIYFVPHDLLHYLPLHALLLNKKPLILSNPVAYLPSASLISFCRKKGSKQLNQILLFGTEFEEETEILGKLLKTKPVNGPLANKKTVLEKVPSADLVHFSCHGRFSDVNPLSSGIILFNNEVLTAREIYNLRTNAELITLSACETGLNYRSRGDDLIGLTRAFIYAGAPTVLVSLWKVSGKSTKELMAEFYEHLKRGCDKATALQKAQSKIMKKDEYSHPFFWAPFVLVGDYE